jgi:vacuolar-type H+-ATPase subunit E/Vma4
VTGLESVRIHHLAAARGRANAILQDAHAQAQRILTRSQAEAAALIARAEQEGDEAADLDTGREWASARRRARGIILATQREVYVELVAAVAAGVRSDPRYKALLQRLADAARRALGPGAEVMIDPAGDRGVTASRKDRHVEWPLEKIVEQSLARLGPGIQELWR